MVSCRGYGGEVLRLLKKQAVFKSNCKHKKEEDSKVKTGTENRLND